MKPISNKTIDEIIGFENRQMALQREYLESIGWVAEDYLVKRFRSKKKAREIHAEIQLILEEEQRDA